MVTRMQARNYRIEGDRMWRVRIYLTQYEIDWVKRKARKLGPSYGRYARVGAVVAALVRYGIDRAGADD